MKKHKHQYKNAFTLVEMLIVITILGVLASIITIGYQSFIINANQTAISTAVDSYQKSFKGYTLEKKSYPTDRGCIPQGSKCCLARWQTPTTVRCATDTEGNWASTSPASDVGKYVNSNPPKLPFFADLAACTSGVINGPCTTQPTASPFIGFFYLYNGDSTSPTQYYSSTNSSVRGFLFYYISVKYKCGSKHIMTASGGTPGNLDIDNNADYTRATSTYRECIVALVSDS